MGSVKHENSPETLAGKIKDATGESIERCYQCGKCTAGCPMAAEMDITPSKMMRMLQYGTPEMEDQVVRSFTVWLCLTCGTCLARCPQEIDIPAIMDHLRSESYHRKTIHPKAGDIVSFLKSFLNSMKITGKLYEFGLVMGYKARTMNILHDLHLTPKLIFRGKLNPLPHFVRDRKHMRAIFKKTLK